jgi:hypothetical protein
VKRAVVLAVAGAVVACGTAGSQEQAMPGLQAVRSKPPEVQVGPYRVAIDRVTHNNTVIYSYKNPQAKEQAPLEYRRTVQLQLGVFAKDASAAAGLTSFVIRSVTVEGAKRLLEVPHYGGVMENPNDTAAVRAYLYVPSFPVRAREIRTVEGEIVGYDRSSQVEIDVPVADAKLPLTEERGGVKVTVQELTVQGATVQLVLRTQGPEGSVLAPTANDGTYGVSLYNADNRAAAPAGGTLTQPRSNEGEYRLGFQNLRGSAGRVRVRLLLRGGERRVYPFKIERVPVPTRSGK